MAQFTVLSQNKLDHMKEYVSFQRMIRNRAERTVYRYARDLYQIEARLGMNPDQLVDYVKSHSELDYGDLKAKLIEGLSESMKYILNNDLRRLLRSNGYKDLPEERIRYTPETDHEAYARDEIRNILGWINYPKGKLVVHGAAESGLRINSILSLQYRHVKEDYEAGKVPIFIKFDPRERERQKANGYTFLGEGSYRLVKECIDNGTIKTKPDSYLFESSHQNAKDGRPLTYAAIHDTLVLAREKAKINPKIQPAHGFRKYLENQLIKGEVHTNIIKRILGHSLGSADAYVTKNPDELRAHYLKAWPHINLDLPSKDLEKVVADQSVQLQEMKTMQDRVTMLENVIRQAETMGHVIPGFATREEWRLVMDHRRKRREERGEPEPRE